MKEKNAKRAARGLLGKHQRHLDDSGYCKNDDNPFVNRQVVFLCFVHRGYNVLNDVVLCAGGGF